jgi:HK97 family phage major capsid protein
MKKSIKKMDGFTADTTLDQYLAFLEITNFDELPEEEQASIVQAYQDELAKLASDMAEENKAVKNELKIVKSQMEVGFKEISAKMEKMKSINQVIKSFSQNLRESLEANKEALKSLKEKGEGRVSFKAVGDMTFANVSGGNVPVEDRMEGLNVLASRETKFLSALQTRSTSSNVISWVAQASKEGAAGATAEGALKNQIDFDLVVASENVKKTTAFIKVSNEMLDDIDWMQSEIEAELMRELYKAIESGAFSGAGTGATLKGVNTVATAFAITGADFGAPIDNPNLVDVLVAGNLQIELAEQGSANLAFLNPKDVAKLKVDKVSGTDKRYIDRLQSVGSSLLLDGVTKIVPTTLVTAGTFLMGNFDKAFLVEKDGVKYDLGYENDDFTKNFVTLRAEWRGAVVVKTNDRTAFVKGNIETAKTALETT